ncbi:alpha/beta hydrolase [Algoriphagus sp.]|uniref:alpha/beta hydrolase n=1 Tax=Algoriphagus sp. TaxID=1872435 RepID=UPI0025FEE98B|nr:alpha/beta hydrolase [Algoriphagus sp.]
MHKNEDITVNKLVAMKLTVLTLFLLLNAPCVNAQVKIFKDIDYINESDYQDDKDLLDIYLPEGKKNVPVIVYFHGGALLMGDKSWGEDIGNKLAESGIGLVSVNYRLSPNVQHPDHVKDAAAAYEWVKNNIEAYGGNPEQIYVGGHSAGAYLAALLSVDFSLLQARGIPGSDIAGAILISPFLYVEETAKDRIAMDSTYKSIWGTDPENWLKASVTPHILPNRDNILLIYADGDDAWRKEQNERFASAMRAAGNLNVSTEEVPNRTHGTILTSILATDDKVVSLISDFILKD